MQETTIFTICQITLYEPHSYKGGDKMKKQYLIDLDGDERTITLVPKFGYLSLPVGTVMYSIDGERVIVGEDEIDQTPIAEGYLKYGILEGD